MIKSIEEHQQELDQKDCKWCRRTDSKESSFVFLKGLKIEHYDHEAGYKVKGFRNRKWLYVTCPKCKYQWSFKKLGIV
jgi:hypothetical protein